MDHQILVALAAGWIEDKLHEVGRSHGKFFKLLRVGGDAKQARLHLLDILIEAAQLLKEQHQGD